MCIDTQSHDLDISTIVLIRQYIHTKRMIVFDTCSLVGEYFSTHPIKDNFGELENTGCRPGEVTQQPVLL